MGAAVFWKGFRVMGIEQTKGLYPEEHIMESIAISLKRIADVAENYIAIDQKKLDDRNKDFAELIAQVKDAFE